jgi:hypothetical protein
MTDLPIASEGFPATAATSGVLDAVNGISRVTCAARARCPGEVGTSRDAVPAIGTVMQ